MGVRIELLTDRIDAFDTKLGNAFKKMFVDQFEALAVDLVFFFPVCRERIFEQVDDRDQSFDQASGGTPGILGAFLLDALAIVVEVGLTTEQRLAQIFKFGQKLRGFCVVILGFLGDILRVGGRRFRTTVAPGALRIDVAILVRHFLASLLPEVSQILLSVSLNNCATYATAVMARS